MGELIRLRIIFRNTRTAAAFEVRRQGNQRAQIMGISTFVGDLDVRFRCLKLGIQITRGHVRIHLWHRLMGIILSQKRLITRPRLFIHRAERNFPLRGKDYETGCGCYSLGFWVWASG